MVSSAILEASSGSRNDRTPKQDYPGSFSSSRRMDAKAIQPSSTSNSWTYCNEAAKMLAASLQYMASKYTLPRHGLLTSKTRTPTAVQYTGFAMRTCYLKWCLRHASGHTTTTPTATPTMLNMWIFWNSEKRFWKSYGEQKTKTLGGDHSSSLGHVSVVSSLLKLDFRYLCSR